MEPKKTTHDATLWAIRTLGIALLGGLAWRASEGELPVVLLIGFGGALLLQLLFLVALPLKRFPHGHDLFSAFAAGLLGSATLALFPDTTVPILLLGLLPLLDLARSRGAMALLYLFLFPLPALVLRLLSPDGPPLDWWQVGAWGVAALLAVALLSVRPSLAPVAAKTERRNSEESPGSLLARFSHLLVSTTTYDRILEILVRSGTDLMEQGSRKGRARAIAFTFKPGLRDVLVVGAAQNMESQYTSRSYDLVGVLGTLLQDGDPIDTDASHAPFNEIRSLQDHRILLFPLRTGIDVYGGFMLATKDEERANDVEVQRTLIALADQASLALHNAVLQQELRRDNDARLGGEEEARHQLARDLHDGPVQRVAAISMQLEFIKALMQRQPDRALAEVEQLQQVAKHASQEMRTMLFTLRPVVLESEGLTAALDTFVKRLREQDRLNITFDADPMPRLSPKAEEVAFAILQEAIGNAKKYANGAPIRVRLIKGNHMIVGQVEDEGPGFDLAAVTASYSKRASLGLLNMQERAAMVGGQFKIDTAPGKGTIVSVAVPSE